ncbi:PLP-dependent aminotransferase family protein [Enterococcus faecalis]|nr:PLP-dependent aminotransferase family protein [Enterococcus faecalis]
MPINSYENYALSWRPVKERLTRPYYQSLVQQLEADILSGALQKNVKLPSQRELADYLDLNFTTIGQAYKHAMEKGLLYTNIGSGTFVSPNAFRSITISTNQVADHLIDLGLVSSFDMCNQRILPFIESVSKNAALNSLLNYRDPLGTHFQRATAAEWLQTQGVRTNAEEVAIVSGVQNGLAVTLAAAFSPGQRIAVDRYTYSNFIELAQLYHLEIVPIGYDSEGMDPEHLLQECKKKKIHGIFLMPACNNPIGFQMSSARRMTLAEIIQQEHLWVIEDDIHSFLTTYAQQAVLPTFQELLPQQTIYLAGMTKFVCTGLRIAYLVFPPLLCQEIERAIFNINVKTSGFDAEIVTQVLRSPVAEELVIEKLALTKQANDLFDTIFGLARPSNPLPYYRTIPLSTEKTAPQIEQEFLQNGVRLFHSSRFTVQNQPDAFLRISLASNQLEVLAKGLTIIQELLPTLNEKKGHSL